MLHHEMRNGVQTIQIDGPDQRVGQAAVPGWPPIYLPPGMRIWQIDFAALNLAEWVWLRLAS